MRSFGETGFAGSCAKRRLGRAGEDRGGPGELQELAAGGLAERGHEASWTRTSLGRAPPQSRVNEPRALV